MNVIAANSELQVDTPEARTYNRIRRRLSIYAFLLNLVGLVILLATRWTFVLHDLANRFANDNYDLALFYYLLMLAVLSKLLDLGIDFYSFRLEHRFRLSNQKLHSWLWDEAKEWALGLALGAFVVELLYFLIRVMPDFWWIIAWALFLAMFILFAQIAPVVLFPIFYKFQPLEREELKQRLTKLSERAGARVRGVYEWKLSEKSKKANAALTGLGNTRRIILADTLLENFSNDEIEAVLAHELGHHVHKHIFKSILVEAGVTFAGFWASCQVLRYSVQRGMFPSESYFANLPLLGLVSALFSFLLLPALNAWSRHNERQADRYAFQAIASVAPFIDSMNKLAAQNLAERAPSRWIEVFFHSHPSISRRIAAARAWAEKSNS